MNARRALSVSAIVMVACLVGLGLAEFGLELLGMAPSAGLTTVTMREFAVIPGIFSPSVAFVDDRNKHLLHSVTIDSLGYRGADFPRRKPADEFRVLLVGDSFVYGDYVSDEATLPARVEAELLAAGCRNVRVINAGLPGSTITEHSELIRRARAIEPDLVLLAFSENDVTDLAATPQWEMMRRNREVKSSFPFGYIYPLARKTALWNLAMRVRGQLRTVQGDAPGVAIQREGEHAGIVSNPELQGRYAQGLREVAAELKRDSIPFVMASFPLHLTVYGKFSADQLDWLKTVAADAGVPLIPTLDVLRADGRGETELFLLPHDGHPSAAGYAVAGREVAARLRAMSPLAARCAAGVN